ncbi:hypothetical protein [Pleomorphomonas oryzae]|uniref:hypothetical protein n=1 Tax=Pleomorphomonas oryzae TaxID=261934 RepID=UPI00047B0F43|nr:hypothetical protein [Pleomorphomonas oryzae]
MIAFAALTAVKLIDVAAILSLVLGLLKTPRIIGFPVALVVAIAFSPVADILSGQFDYVSILATLCAPCITFSIGKLIRRDFA